MHIILYILGASFQVVIGAALIRGFWWVIPRSFGYSHIHPKDVGRPFKVQRIKIRDDGEARDYVPRKNVWVGLFAAIILAICWLVFYRYFGLLIWPGL